MKAFAMLSISDARLFDRVMDRVLQLLELVSPQVGLLTTKFNAAHCQSSCSL